MTQKELEEACKNGTWIIWKFAGPTGPARYLVKITDERDDCWYLEDKNGRSLIVEKSLTDSLESATQEEAREYALVFPPGSLHDVGQHTEEPQDFDDDVAADLDTRLGCLQDTAVSMNTNLDRIATALENISANYGNALHPPRDEWR